MHLEKLSTENQNSKKKLLQNNEKFMESKFHINFYFSNLKTNPILR